MAARTSDRLVTAGRRAWALLGIALVLVAVFLLLARVGLVVIALLLALFPAALLAPAVAVLRRRGVPATVASLLVLVALLGSLALVFRLVAPAIGDEVPAFLTAAERGLERAEDLVEDTPLAFDADGFSDVAQRVTDALGGRGDVAGRGLSVATTLLDVLTGLVLAVIALFFYLRDGRRLWSALTDLVPVATRRTVDDVGQRIWWTLGAYFRGQLLVALFDAVFIGLGLLLLGVPLALPLAVVLFFGGLFPIVGAFVSGLLAVLVALTAGGLPLAALTLGLVVLVQQVEGNFLEPLILSKVIALHPLVVIASITAGAVAFGVLGAFLAVPLAASTARTVDYIRDRRPEAGPGSAPDDDSS